MTQDLPGTPLLGNGTVTGIDGGDPHRIVDKAALLSGEAFGIIEVPFPGLGVVRVKPLSRAQAMTVYEREMPVAEMEQIVVSMACVEPTFTPAEVEILQDRSTAGGPLYVLVQKILDISGMEVGAGKAAYKRFRGAS